MSERNEISRGNVLDLRRAGQNADHDVYSMHRNRADVSCANQLFSSLSEKTMKISALFPHWMDVSKSLTCIRHFRT